MPRNTTATQPSSPLAPFEPLVPVFRQLFATPEGMAVLLALIALLILHVSTGGKRARATRKQLAHSQWAKPSTIARAKRIALEQLEEGRPDRVPLWFGPRHAGLFDREGLPIPEANRSILALGNPGAGKSDSAVSPGLISAIECGYPILLWDFKYPDQASIIAPIAAAHGYRVHFFTPGLPGSETLNPIVQFVKGPSDAIGARQLAEIWYTNYAKTNEGGDNPFFGKSGIQLVAATIQLARTMPYPDLATCSKLLALPNLAARVIAAKDSLNPWVVDAFNQYLATLESPETEAGIKATAQLMFQQFQSEELLGVLCGDSTIPTVLTGKTLVVLGLDTSRRDVLLPLFAATINSIVNESMAARTSFNEPLVCGFDELPTIVLPALKNWINEFRSRGLIVLGGVQHLSQFYETYGKDRAATILGAFGTQFFFNPNNPETAEWIEKFLGSKEVEVYHRNSSVDASKRSASDNVEVRAVPLYAAAQINTLPQGRAVVRSAGIGDSNRAYLPFLYQFPLSRRYRKKKKWAQKIWKKSMYPAARAAQLRSKEFNGVEALILREKSVRDRFPDSLVTKAQPTSPKNKTDRLSDDEIRQVLENAVSD